MISPKYHMEKIRLEELMLDEKNPRFIVPPNPSQQNIIDYLIDYEEVEQLAMDINTSGGLFAGERIIAIKENDKYIVLEGNRRVCACKILMNPQLLRNRRPASIGKIYVSEKVKEDIEKIDVDVMENRTTAQSTLAAKHIDGIKKWSTISKYKFFVLEFDAGRTIDEISMVTGVTKAKIKTGLKEYRIISYVLDLPYWTEEQKRNYLNLQEIKTTRLTRLFSAKTKKKENERLRELLKLEYDEKYQVISALPRDIFDEALYIIGQAAFVEGYCENFEGTRSTYEDIPQFMKFIEKNNLCAKSAQDINGKNNLCKKSAQDISEKNECIVQNKIKEIEENIKEVPKDKPVNKNEDKKYTSKRNVLIPEDFSVKCKVVKINDIIYELKKLNFSYCINAQAVLLRVLIELSIKYYFNMIGESEHIKEGHLEGNYVAALEYMRKHDLLRNAEHSNLVQLRKNNQIFNVFNGYVHYDSVLPNKESIIHCFDNIRKFLEICLNA